MAIWENFDGTLVIMLPGLRNGQVVLMDMLRRDDVRAARSAQYSADVPFVDNGKYVPRKLK